MKAGKGKRAHNDKPVNYFSCLFFQKDTSLYEGPFAVECWLRRSNCIDAAVFGGVIKDCATVGGAIVGSAIVAAPS